MFLWLIFYSLTGKIFYLGEEGSLGVGSDGYDSDSSNPDSGLSPLQKLEKYMYSEHSYSR